MPSPGLDVVGAAEALPFVDGSFAGAILQAVLHQVRDADRALSEVARVLEPGGRP